MQAAGYSTHGFAALQRAAEATPGHGLSHDSSGSVTTPRRSAADTAPAGFNTADLERIADEVYTIIERRLIREREAMGL
jgi:hypothetical protein